MREKKEINIQIGERVRIAREQTKLTQEALAERIEVSPQYISDLERGVVGISIPTLKRVCIALGISSDQILFGTISESRNAAIEKRCSNLSDADFYALLDIVDAFSTAVMNARSNK
ncbi:MAG: helix-turn-helix transcriptional regulator [Oscillospiraceae bacterium]|nr:helix-turn-helix transcriptional regulator [Oscillospiraceae bacterium]